MKFIFIADFFSNQIMGGGELNNDEAVDQLIKMGHKVTKINSHVVTSKLIKDNVDSNYIIANFINLSKPCMAELMNRNYIIYEHDHKYLKTRNPAFYKDYKAPKDEIINLDFYKNAKAVLCQSSFHASIIKKNINIDNIVNLSGNLWSEKSLKIMKNIADTSKKNICSIMNSRIPHKNTSDAIKFCKAKNLDYELISSTNYEDFLAMLGANDKFVFFPKTPETLSRVAVEARMMNMSVIVNKNLGATHEPWFKLKGKDLIDIVYEMRNQIPLKIVKVFS